MSGYLLPPRWYREAICAQTDPEVFFPSQGQSADSARRICATCPVQPECLTYALDHPNLRGIWGGTSETQRKRLRGKTRRAATPRTSATANP